MRIETGAVSIVWQLISSFGAAFILIAIPLAAQAHTENGGNVTLLAGEQYRQVGSDVIAAKGDIDIAAKTVDIVEARETSRTTIEQKSKQSGFTVAFTNPVITAVQTAQQMASAAKDTSDPRMKALAAASTGLARHTKGVSLNSLSIEN